MSRSFLPYSAILVAGSLVGCAGSAQVEPLRSPLTDARSTQEASHRQASGGNIYVANQTQQGPPWAGQVLVYPVGSDGNVAPSVTIGGSNTLLTQANGIVVDGSGNIYVANSDTNSIVGFPAGSNGNVSPTVNISGSNTGLASPLGLAIDNAGNLYVANCGSSCGFGPPGQTSIEEFAPGSNGNVAPIRTISGERAGFGGQIKGITLDRTGVVSVAGWTSSSALSFGPEQHGNVYPRRVIAGSQTEIMTPDGIAAGADGLYVASNGGPHITRYAPRANGDAPPRSLLHEPALGGITAAPDGTIYAAGLNVASIYQYAANARGHDAALTTISGSSTGLITPTFVYVN